MYIVGTEEGKNTNLFKITKETKIGQWKERIFMKLQFTIKLILLFLAIILETIIVGTFN